MDSYVPTLQSMEAIDLNNAAAEMLQITPYLKRLPKQTL